MDIPRNKPRVFLGHAKEDSEFINRAANDFHGCQIDTWIYTEDVRHGHPWLDAVFDGGIPTCDCLLFYFTEHSIKSRIVKKEIDASLLQTLKDSHVAFLGYVSDASLRPRLRSDLQSLHIPEWNFNNYHELLPKVVAEIWHNYMDGAFSLATQQERTKRLEAELELERLRKTQEERPFSPSEEADFRFIWKCIDRYEPVVFSQTERQGEEKRVLKSYPFEVHIGSFILQLASGNNRTLHWRKKADLLFQVFNDKIPDSKSLPKGTSLLLGDVPDIEPEMLMYGLLQHEAQQPSPSDSKILRAFIIPSHIQVFTNKMARFRYWLRYNQCLPDAVVWRPGPTQNNAAS